MEAGEVRLQRALRVSAAPVTAVKATLTPNAHQHRGEPTAAHTADYLPRTTLSRSVGGVWGWFGTQTGLSMRACVAHPCKHSPKQ